MFIRDFPKLHSPFVKDNHIVTPKIENGYEWIFNNGTIATEKLDGTDVSIIIEGGRITRIFNRTNEVDLIKSDKDFIIEAIRESYHKGYCNFTDGQYFGECIGRKLQKNPYKLDGHIWIPFDPYCKESLNYRCWNNITGTVDVSSKESVSIAFDIISEWFQYGLYSRFTSNKGIENQFAEGIVFYSVDGKIAKLRRDMFCWYKGNKHNEHTRN